MEHHGLNHIHIVVSDLARSLRFYEALGYQRVAGHDDMHFLVRQGGSDILTLREGEGHEIDHFGFMLKDASTLDEAIEVLEKAGGKLVERLMVGPNPSAILEDPDGYRVQI